MKRLAALSATLVALAVMPYAQSPLPLVQPGQLVWDGAFRVPPGNFGADAHANFGYGGWALAYHAANDSLFIVGHDYLQAVAEITIPTAVKGKNANELSTAKVLQPFADPTDGRRLKVDPEESPTRIGGMLVHGGRLIIGVHVYYDGNSNATASHFTDSLRLSDAGQATGPHRVGRLNAGFYGTHMAAVPAAWQSALGAPAITGGCCLAVVNRTSLGPSAFAFDPAQLSTTNPTPAVPLLYYPIADPLQPWDKSNTDEFNGTTEMAGSLIPAGTRSILFIGRQGTGKFTYSGFTQAPPYQVQVWAYDLNDLVAVKNGRRRSWDPRPYAIWALTGHQHPSPLPFFEGRIFARGVAYDPATQRVWLAAVAGDGERPMIHQFRVDLAVSKPSTPPRR